MVKIIFELADGTGKWITQVARWAISMIFGQVFGWLVILETGCRKQKLLDRSYPRPRTCVLRFRGNLNHIPISIPVPGTYILSMKFLYWCNMLMTILVAKFLRGDLKINRFWPKSGCIQILKWNVDEPSKFHFFTSDSNFSVFLKLNWDIQFGLHL